MRTSSERPGRLQSLCFRKVPVCLRKEKKKKKILWVQDCDHLQARVHSLLAYPGSLQAANLLMEGSRCF